MSAGTPVTMSQGFEVLAPQSGKAYPIPCNEWDVLKSNIRELTFEPQLFHTAGVTLLGAGLSTLITIWTGAISTTLKNAEVIAWSVVAVCLVCGAACCLLALRERKLHRNRAGEVVTQMTLIEQRFERSET